MTDLEAGCCAISLWLDQFQQVNPLRRQCCNEDSKWTTDEDEDSWDSENEPKTKTKKLICHDKVDFITMKTWFQRNKLADLFENMEQLDSQDFYIHVMKEQMETQLGPLNDFRGVKYGMKAIVKELASERLERFYEENKHSAVGYAETLCLLSNSRAMHDRFRSWVLCYQHLIGSIPASKSPKKRSQSTQRFFCQARCLL